MGVGAFGHVLGVHGLVGALSVALSLTRLSRKPCGRQNEQTDEAPLEGCLRRNPLSVPCRCFVVVRFAGFGLSVLCRGIVLVEVFFC